MYTRGHGANAKHRALWVEAGPPQPFPPKNADPIVAVLSPNTKEEEERIVVFAVEDRAVYDAVFKRVLSSPRSKLDVEKITRELKDDHPGAAFGRKEISYSIVTR